MAKRENIIRAYERAVEQLFSDKVTFADYLDFSGRFYKLPSSQTIMIFDDNPNAKMVADFDTWQQFGRRIKPGGWSTDVLDNGKIKRLYDISMTRGDKTPYQWSLNKKTAEEFSDRLSKSEDRNFTGMSDCIYHLADNAVRERFEDVVNLLDIPEKDEDIFRKSFASMVRRVIAARCEWGSDFTYGGTGAVKGVDLSALDFLDNSEDMETLLEEVQITAKNVLKSMERSINDIIFERSIDNERNERVDRTRGIDIGRGGSSSVVRGGEDVFAVDNDTERENVQARREDVSVQPDDGVVSDGRGTGTDDEPDKPLGESVAEIYDGEPPVGYTEPTGKIFVGADTAQNRQGGVGDLGENTGGISSDEPAPDIGERNSLGGTAESNDRGTDNGVSGERAEDGTVISENNENTLTAENNSAVNYLSLKIAELSDAFEKKYNGDYKEFTLANYAFTHVGAEYDLNLSVRNNAENMLRGGQQAYLKEYLNAVFKEAFEGRVIVDEGIVAGELMSRLVKSDRKKNAEPLTADITASADGSEQLRLFPEPLDKKQQAELDKLTSDLKKEFENWENILLDGNTDPFYEDGVSLDLIRNHIIHDKSILEEKFPDNLPEIYHKETPPEYPFTYQSVKKGDTLRFEYGDYTVLNIEKTTGTGEYFVELQDENGEIITQNLREIKTKFRNLTNHGEAPNRADARNTIQAVSENVSPVTRELSVDFVPYNEQKVISASKIGDFYEFYGETAKELSEKFSLTLTKRNGEPMVGVPAYSFDDFCSELYDKGYIVENWGHYQEVIKPQVAKSPSLTRAEELINEYCEREHDSEGDFSNPQRVGLAYTDDEETGLPIEVYADLEQFRIVTEFNNVIVAEEQYNSLDEMCNMALNNLSFDELVYLPEEQRKKGIEKNFDEAQLELPGDVDKFYINKENESVTWVYYNADSDKGGQLVYHHFTFDQLFDNLFKDDVAEAITQAAKTELVDADDPAFKERAQDFLADNEDFSFSGEWDRHKLSAVVEPIYAISQLFSSADAERNGNDFLRDYRFASLSDLQQRGLYVDRENYRTVYRGRLKDGETLEDIYTKFNVNHPTDFRGHSLSVGDIVVIRQDGKPTAHYVDSVGFEEVHDYFLDKDERQTRRTLIDNITLYAENQLASDDMDTMGEYLFDNVYHYDGLNIGDNSFPLNELHKLSERYKNGEDIRWELGRGIYAVKNYISAYDHTLNSVSVTSDEFGMNFKTKGGFEIFYAWDQLGEAMIIAAKTEYARHNMWDKASEISDILNAARSGKAVEIFHKDSGNNEKTVLHYRENGFYFNNSSDLKPELEIANYLFENVDLEKTANESGIEFRYIIGENISNDVLSVTRKEYDILRKMKPAESIIRQSIDEHNKNAEVNDAQTNKEQSDDSLPTITCEWSESPVFEDGKTYSVYEFDALMKQADDERTAGAKAAIAKYGSKEAWYNADAQDEFTQFYGYDKVKFTVNMPDGTHFTERQDIGDGYGGVIEFLSKYPQDFGSIIPILEQARMATEILSNEEKASPVTQLSSDVISDFREKTDEYYNKLGGYSAHDAEELVKYFIRAAIRENELSAEVGEVVLYGSRCRRMENDNSDLDFVAEMYSDLKEDTLFNILHETPFEIGGVTVDINPIRTEESGSLEDYLIGAEQYLQQKGAKDNNAPAVQDYRVEETEQTSFGQKSRYAANIAAIKTLLQIEGENRAATPDEQKVLAQYVGWGGIPSVFDSDNTAWAAEYAELKELLAPDEYEAARSTVLTAHYTSPTIISAVYSALDKFGFKGGNVLEPSMGIGNFFGVMPDEMRSQSHLHGVELDDISGRIAKQLYPNADIQICGYENTAFSDNFFDAAVGNVPFGNYPVADTRYDREHFLIHDYFFAKTLDKVAPGGVVAFITSKGTLDKTNPKVREYLAKRADLIGAIRLPDNAFKANAGTEVTADIVFLQKREKLSTEKPDWCYTAEIAEGISVNQYFVDHPEMILGEMQLVSGRYGEETTCIPIEGAGLKELLNAAIMRLSRDIITVRREDKRNEEHGIIPATADVRNFTFTEVNDKIYFRENNIMREIPFSKRNHERMRGMIGIRNTFRELVDAQSEGCSDETLSGLQFRLNSEYDAFVINWGHISDIDNRKVFAVDDDYNTLCGALELIDPETKEVTKADIFTKRTIKPYVEVTHVDTPQEALFVSLDMRGFADIDYMAELCGASNDEVINELTEGGFIYKNPETENYEEAAEYLSGYVREKLRQAQDASADNPEYERNVAALEKALPPKLGAGDISVRLGAPWITIDDYCKFFNEYAQGAVSKGSYFSRDTVLYRSVSGEYKIENKNADKSVAAQSSFGTKRMNSYAIFENLLNNRDIAVYDTSELPDGKKKRVMNKDETQLAQEKARQMKEAFPKWLWSDPERREKYVEIYNDLFNSLVGREYDGSHQTFPGMNPFIELNEHQKNAVMRAKLGGNTLLAHCVGAGKTFEMAAAVMEKRRLGLINKACIVVPKHLVGQMSAEWLRLYPEARLLTAKENDFNDVNRQKFIGRCCTGDYDAVIMSYQQFQKIPMSIEYQKEFLTEQLSSLTEQLQDFSGYLSADDKRSVKDLERMKKNTEAKLKRLLDTPHDNSLNFEQLGFDCIVADEAHNYKNGLVVTKMKNVSGIGSRAAKKSEDFLMKTRYLNEKFGERNLILASGTPVSNSMTELYIMQQYLRPSALRRQGLQNFDDWASTFGEVVSQLELKPAGDGFRMKKRFAKFTNLPELMQAYKDFADIRTAEMLNLPVPEVESGKPQVISAKPNEFQQAYMKVLADRSEAIHSGSVDPSVDNMLKITNEARLLGLDARTINPDADNYPNSKVNLLIEKVMEIYTETTAQKGVQAIFCDIAINDGKKDINEIAIEIEEQSDDNEKTLSAEELSELLTASKFSVYKYIKEELIRRGIPEAEICFAGDAKDQGQRGELYAQLRAGTKRIVLASTTKMGTGANIQTRLCALHNLDIPWKPSDFEQRIGRIVRQGNKFPTVKIFNYVTEGTFDAYMLNLIVTKQKFISQLMSGKTPARTCEDVDELVLNYSEMQAIASGDPRIKEKIQLDTDVSRLRLLENEHLNKKYQLEDKVTFCQSQISIAKKQLALASDDKEFAVKNALPEGEFKITLNGKIFTERKEAGAELRKAQMAFLSKKQATVIGEYRGFKMSLNWGLVSMNQYTVSVDLTKPDKGLRYSTELELQNDLGNITRLENILKHGIDKRISGLQADLARNEKDLAEALRTKDAPFEYADELAQKSLRLAQLDAELGVGKKDEIIIDDENQEDDRGRGRDNNSPDKNRMPKRPKR